MYTQHIGNHTRTGGPDKLRLERIVEAAKSPEASLTYSALMGRHKQSVADVE